MRAPRKRVGPAKANNAKSNKKKAGVRDPEGTSRRIIEAATAEFAERGYDGARVERIVANADCNMRMVYHYYGSKERLYLAVLDSIYEDIRGKERLLALDHLEPVEGIAALVDFTVSHFVENKTFVQLTMNENLQRGIHIARSRRIPQISSPLIEQVTGLLRRGEVAGLFREAVDPLQLYVTIVALSCHHINNAYTLSATFGTDITQAAWRAKRRRHVHQLVLSYLTDLRPG